eukprot:CAMPEP_0119301946 /NCGR_PEP_ID=MMETSP1333-20130426/3638_1 /TAXON_ID=418940 /ORGANISM="Scyphosphaera apsteinii, Strain RCC1455" /LENGTH=63 /DNA_ID=CAMNT_0007304159 /DNA_START=614 /DNA_END=801 /DNA_ORIENTATION=-
MGDGRQQIGHKSPHISTRGMYSMRMGCCTLLEEKEKEMVEAMVEAMVVVVTVVEAMVAVVKAA